MTVWGTEKLVRLGQGQGAEDKQNINKNKVVGETGTNLEEQK